MLLHNFLVHTFGPLPFRIADIARAIPIHLALQILRGIDPTQPYVNLSMVYPLRPRDELEIDTMLPCLRPPFHCLVNRNNTANLTARVEVPGFGISRHFDFVWDKAAYSDYWILYFSVISEKTDPFPVQISRRFRPMLSKILSNVSLHQLPFFPRQVERISQRLGVSAAVLSYSLRSAFKRRLRSIHCSRSSITDAKLFPSAGLAALLVTKASALPVDRPRLPEQFDFQLEAQDCSLRSLAKLAATSRLTKNGYILDQTRNFMLFREHIRKWIFWTSRTRNLVCSLNEDPVFRALFYHEMANLIQLMRTPLLEGQPIVVEQSEPSPVGHSPTFVLDSRRFIQKLSAHLPERDDVEMKSRDELNKVFTTRMPKAPQRPRDVRPAPDFNRHVCHRFATNLDEPVEDKEVVRSPVFDLEGTMEATESVFLAMFNVSRRVCDCPFSVSVAVEFLKVVLSNTNRELFATCLRQVSHLPISDVNQAIFFLDGCGIYRANDRMEFPKNNWSFDCPAVDPHPMSLAVYDEGELTLNWGFKKGLQLKRFSWYVPVPKFYHSLRNQMTKFPLPKIPPFQVQPVALRRHESDVLLQFTFGRYESDFPQFADFPHRFVFNLIHSAGVDGMSFRDLINPFGVSLNDYTGGSRILRIVYDLLSWELVARVPSATIDAHFSRFLPVNKLYREVDKKVEMVNVHVWIHADGSVDRERLGHFRKNIVVYVFAHEFCDFEELMKEFCYLSPFDLCLIVDALEDEEVLVSQFCEKRSGGLLDEEMSRPIGRFEFPELFLALLDRQRHEASPEVTVHRMVRTGVRMFENMSLVHRG
jgi:hypothetical protein